jgi:hypothetical protein
LQRAFANYIFGLGTAKKSAKPFKGLRKPCCVLTGSLKGAKIPTKAWPSWYAENANVATSLVLAWLNPYGVPQSPHPLVPIVALIMFQLA